MDFDPARKVSGPVLRRHKKKIMFWNKKNTTDETSSIIANEVSEAIEVKTEVVEKPKPTLVVENLPTASELLQAVNNEGKLDDKDTVLGTIIAYILWAMPEFFTTLVESTKAVTGRFEKFVESLTDLPGKFAEMQTQFQNRASPILDELRNDLTELWRSSVAERGERLAKIHLLRQDKDEAEGELATHIVRLTGLPDSEKPEPIKGEWAVPLIIVAVTIAIDWVLGTDTFAIASNQDISGVISFVGALVLAGMGIASGQYTRQYVAWKSAVQFFTAEFEDKGGYSYSATKAGLKLNKMKDKPEDLVTSVYPLDYSIKFGLKMTLSFFIGLIVFITVMRGYIIYAYLDNDWSQFMSTGILFAATGAGFIAKYLLSSPFSKTAMKKWDTLQEEVRKLTAELEQAEKTEDPYAAQAKERLGNYAEALTQLKEEIALPVRVLSDEKQGLVEEIGFLQLERNVGIRQLLDEFTLEVVNEWQNRMKTAWTPRPSANRMSRDFDNESGWQNLDGIGSQLNKLVVPTPTLTNPTFDLGEFEKKLAEQFPLPVQTDSGLEVKVQLRAIPPIRALGS